MHCRRGFLLSEIDWIERNCAQFRRLPRGIINTLAGFQSLGAYILTFDSVVSHKPDTVHTKYIPTHKDPVIVN